MHKTTISVLLVFLLSILTGCGGSQNSAPRGQEKGVRSDPSNPTSPAKTVNDDGQGGPVEVGN